MRFREPENVVGASMSFETAVTLTIDQTISELQAALRDYIEAAYHISDPAMVSQRSGLLRQLGVVHQKPYIESTPRYVLGPKYSAIPGLDAGIADLLTNLSLP